MPKDAHEIRTAAELAEALQFYLEAAMERIDATPREVTDALPMPGFGRDEVEALLAIKVGDLEADDPEAGWPAFVLHNHPRFEALGRLEHDRHA